MTPSDLEQVAKLRGFAAERWSEACACVRVHVCTGTLCVY